VNALRVPSGVRRVLMTADAMGGVWTYALELAREFGRRGVAVDLATMGRALTDGERRAAALAGVTLHERPCKLEWMPDPWRDVDAAGDWLLDLEVRTRPDVVHLSSMSHGALPWRVPCLVVAHSCVLSWWEAVRGGPAPASFDVYRRRVGAGLRAADVVVAPSAAMLANVERHYGVRGRRAAIWNARSPRGFSPARKAPVIFAAGRLWDPGKNFSALDRAAARLAWPVRVAGEIASPDGSHATLCHATWMGILDQEALAAELGRAAIYALPARYEPFGLSILEAALSGCALVLGDLPSLREIWGEAACYVPADDPAALAATLDALIGHPAARRRLARRARALAVHRTPAVMADVYLSHYRAARRAQVA
jgi:glycosyltransferase involved in cell wall biosynthesis